MPKLRRRNGRRGKREPSKRKNKILQKISSLPETDETSDNEEDGGDNNNAKFCCHSRCE